MTYISRQDKFEVMYAAFTACLVEDVRKCRMRTTDSYAIPKISAAYYVWKKAYWQGFFEAEMRYAGIPSVGESGKYVENGLQIVDTVEDVSYDGFIAETANSSVEA